MSCLFCEQPHDRRARWFCSISVPSFHLFSCLYQFQFQLKKYLLTFKEYCVTAKVTLNSLPSCLTQQQQWNQLTELQSISWEKCLSLNKVMMKEEMRNRLSTRPKKNSVILDSVVKAASVVFALALLSSAQRSFGHECGSLELVWT